MQQRRAASFSLGRVALKMIVLAIANYCRWNLIVTVTSVAIGEPSSVAGWYFQLLSALIAADCKVAGPETTFIDATSPVFSTWATITTFPEIPALRAAAG